jgi:hypothetical protein
VGHHEERDVSESLTVEVFHQAGQHPPFIVAVNGRVTTDALAEIEKQIATEAELLFTAGDGTYRCQPSYEYPTGDPDDGGGWAVESAKLLEPLVIPDAVLAALDDDWRDGVEPGSAASQPGGLCCQDCGCAADETARCGYCGGTVCDSCYVGRHERADCHPEARGRAGAEDC